MADRGAGGPAAAVGAHGADAAIAELYAAHWTGLVRLASLRDHGSAVAYLRRSVVNRARSSLRHRGVEERYLERQRGERSALGSAGPGPEEHALAHESHDAMIRALGTLSQRQREVLTMRYYLDLSEAEIADALGISAGSVKAHAHRGLAALRAGMEVGR